MGDNYILCVDDDPDDCALIAEFIRKLDKEIDFRFYTKSESALDFLRKAKETQTLPRLIILDLNMPGLGGKDAVKIIKQDAGLKNVPIIVLSTNVRDPDLQELESRGTTLIRKPDNIEGYEAIAKTITVSLL